MNDFDLDRLSQVWREEPPPAELEWMRRSALNVSRRARFWQRVEAGAAVLVALVVVGLVVISPAPQTFVAGVGAILMLLLTQRRQRRLRAVELKSLTGSTEEMLEQSIARTQAALKRNWFSLIGMGPATLLGSLLAHYAQGRATRPLLPEEIGGFLFALFILLLVVAVVHLIVSIRKGAAELARLQTLRETYRIEAERVSD